MSLIKITQKGGWAVSDYPVCPHCGTKNYVGDIMPSLMFHPEYGDDVITGECGICKEPFQLDATRKELVAFVRPNHTCSGCGTLYQLATDWFTDRIRFTKYDVPLFRCLKCGAIELLYTPKAPHRYVGAVIYNMWIRYYRFTKCLFFRAIQSCQGGNHE